MSAQPVVVTLGETMVLLFGSSDHPLAYDSHARLGTGGAESNVAVGLQRLGVRTAWIGRVGVDPFGDRVVRDLRGEGLQVLAIRDDAAPTGIMIKEQRSDRTHVWYARRGSAGSRLCPDDVPDDLIADAELLHVTGITPALSDTAARAVEHAVDVARRNGTIVSFDVNYRSRLWSLDSARATLAPLIERADVLFAGTDEAGLFCPEVPDEQVPAALAELGPTQVVLKRGEAGAEAFVDGSSFRQPAVPVTVVDTVGAGDAFVAGYLAELLAGADVPVRLRTAATMGAVACTVRGDWEGLPTRAELSAAPHPDRVVR